MSFEKTLIDGRQLLDQGDYRGACEMFQKSCNLALIDGVDSYNHALSLSWLGHSELMLGSYEQALTDLESSYALTIKHKGAESLEAAEVLTRLGKTFNHLERFKDGACKLQESLAIYKAIKGPYNAEAAEVTNELGLTLIQEQKLDDAEQHLSKALGLRIKILGEKHKDVAGSFADTSVYYSLVGNQASARAFSKRGLDLANVLLNDDHPQLGIACFNLANQYLKDGMYEKALPVAIRARKIFEKRLDAAHELKIWSMESLATIHMAKEEALQAQDLLTNALVLSQAKWGREDPHVLPSLIGLGASYLHVRDYRNAELYLKMSLSIMQKASELDTALEYRLLDQLSMSYVWQGKLGDAALLMPASLRAKHTSDFTMLMDILHKLAGFVGKQLEQLENPLKR
ncbi:MAG: tetratricopeptide repeat protein [Candidatus Obscuribacterales bacterium]|nr:tetratricopeptide repeat protein [Candidatus Obscuribacterales bacterium]